MDLTAPTTPRAAGPAASRASGSRTVLWLKVAVWAGALSPALWLGHAALTDGLGANPIEKLTHVTGMTALVLLLCTLAVTPVRRLTGWNPVIRLRRLLGLFAFFYAALHFLIWAVLDMTLAWSWMLEDIAQRLYITVGFTAFLLLIPLAVTSTRGWIRRLGRRWARLHRLVYLAATLGVVHFFWLVKSDIRQPLLMAVILAALLTMRLPPVSARLARGARGRRAPRREGAEGNGPAPANPAAEVP